MLSSELGLAEYSCGRGVGRVAEQDDEVADERRDGPGVAREHAHRERVLRDEQYQRHGGRQLDGQEHHHHRHQHQRRAAALGQLPDATATMPPAREPAVLRVVVVGGGSGLGATERSRPKQSYQR